MNIFKVFSQKAGAKAAVSKQAGKNPATAAKPQTTPRPKQNQKDEKEWYDHPMDRVMTGGRPQRVADKARADGVFLTDKYRGGW
jgi:hypothetical protein